MAESVDASNRAPARAATGLAGAAILAAGAVLVLLPVFVWGPTNGHDVGVHLLWTENFGLSLAEGCWYPRWFRHLNGGLGSPTFIFYFPAFAYSATAARLVLPDLLLAMWIVSGLALWVSGLTMTFFLGRYCGRAAALIAAVAYMATPYRLLDLYERAAFPEAMAFVFPPLILAAMDRHARSRSPRWLAVIGFATGALTFTHHGQLVLFLPLLIAYAVLRFPVRDGLLQVVALALGIGVGAMSLLPAILEREYVHWGLWSYHHALLFGSGDVLFGAFRRRLERDALYYAVLALFGLAVAWRLRTTTALLLGVACLGALVLACAPSEPIWEAIPALQMIDLPWRWLGVSSFAGTALVGLALADGAYLRVAAFVCVVLGMTVGTRDWILPAEYLPSLRAEGPDPGAPDRLAVRPRWAPPLEIPPAQGPLLNGRVSLVQATCARQVYDLSANRESTLELDTFYYPGWEARLDGAPLSIRPSRASGRITLRVPKGGHEVILEFRDTPLRTWSAWLSLASLLILAALCLPAMQGRR